MTLPLPKSMAWYKTRDNVRCEDDTVLRYVPWFGDDDNDVDVSAYDHLPDQLSGEISSEAEEVLITYLLNKSPSVEGRKSIVRILMDLLRVSSLELKKSYQKVMGCLMDRKKTQMLIDKSKAQDSIAPTYSAPGMRVLSFSDWQQALFRRRIDRLGDASFVDLEGQDNTMFRNEDLFKTGLGLVSSSKYERVADSYRDFFCRRCYFYDCSKHGIVQPRPSERSDPMRSSLQHRSNSGELVLTKTQPTFTNDASSEASKRSSAKSPSFLDSISQLADGRFVQLVTSFKRSSTSSKLRSTTKSKCSETVSDPFVDIPHCLFAKLGDNGNNVPLSAGKGNDPKKSKSKVSPLTDTEKALVMKLREIFSDNCEAIAHALGTRSPDEVRSFIQSHGTNSEHILTSKTIELSQFIDETHTKSKTNKRLKARILQAQMKPSSRKEYFPCDHEGDCMNILPGSEDALKCSCIERGFCLKFCGCSVECKLRFAGCKCKKGKCRTKVCPCFASGKECDPDLCLSCGASDHPFLTSVSAPLDESTVVCHNTCLHRKQGKHIVVGRSGIHGWGSFTRKAIEKNDFIVEYTGEVITQNESERRGRIYDKLDSNFLFNLNEECCVDASRKGNKAKFVNHSADPNCQPSIHLTSGGDHKIGIFAKRNIAAGEELSFDYGKEFLDTESGCHWTKKGRVGIL